MDQRSQEVAERRAPIKVDVNIPLPWLIGIIVIGLVQFGIFFQQFSDIRTQIEFNGRTVATMADKYFAQAAHDVAQDSELAEHERRISKNEGNLYGLAVGIRRRAEQ